jgi:hypothetical protein
MEDQSADAGHQEELAETHEELELGGKLEEEQGDNGKHTRSSRAVIISALIQKESQTCCCNVSSSCWYTVTPKLTQPRVAYSYGRGSGYFVRPPSSGARLSPMQLQQEGLL